MIHLYGNMTKVQFEICHIAALLQIVAAAYFNVKFLTWWQ